MILKNLLSTASAATFFESACIAQLIQVELLRRQLCLIQIMGASLFKGDFSISFSICQEKVNRLPCCYFYVQSSCSICGKAYAGFGGQKAALCPLEHMRCSSSRNACLGKIHSIRTVCCSPCSRNCNTFPFVFRRDGISRSQELLPG